MAINVRTIFVLLLINFYPIISATTYYIAPTNSSPSGNDSNPGTKEAPWSTINKAITILSAGDTLFFRGGTYNFKSDVLISNKNGTASKPICFFSYPGEKPILDFYNWVPAKTSTNQQGAIYFLNTNYLHIRGLTLRNVRQVYYDNIVMGWKGLNSTNITFTNCITHHIEGKAWRFHNCDYILFFNCDGFEVCDSLRATPGNGGTVFSATSDNNVVGNFIYYYGCRAWRFSDQGFSTTNEGPVVYEKCWAFNPIIISGNVGGGSGFKFGFEDTQYASRTVINCIAAYCNYIGFYDNASSSVLVDQNYYNNTSFNCGWGFLVGNATSDPFKKTITLKNNLAYNNRNGAIYPKGTYNHEYNSWNSPPGITLANEDFISIDTTGIAAPRHADGSFPDNDCYKYFLKLSPNSQAIDKGIDVGLPYSGSYPDLGAWEYGSQELLNNNPTVIITSPINGTGFTTPASINIIVEANDLDGTVTKVEFYNGSLKLAEKSTPPWSYTWNNVQAGSYTITAVATDNDGAKTTSAVVSISVSNSTPTNRPPSISISSPASGTTYSAPATVTITANATDPDGTVSRVEFYSGSTKLGEKTSSPWSHTWNNVQGGSYSLTAIATDNSGAKTTSAAVSITVNNSTPVNQPPSVSILSPASGSTYTAPANLSIVASASDPDGTISKVEFFIGSTKLGEKTSSPWSYTWNNVQAGSFSLTAIATDNSGAKTTSLAISITVNDPVPENQSPVITLSSPTKGKRYIKPANITIDADTYDPDGTVIKVEFFNETKKLAEVTTGPWSFTWKDVDEGIYYITAVATDNMNAATVSTPVEIAVEAGTFYDPESEIFNLYPNPNNGQFTVDFVDPMQTENTRITITSFDGKAIYQGNILQEEITKHFDLSFLKSGIYICILTGREIIVTKKFIKE